MKSILLLFILLNSNLLWAKGYSACENIDNFKFLDAADLMNKSIDLIYESNLSFFQLHDLDRSELCVKITDDSNINAYVLNSEEKTGVIYYHKDLLKTDMKSFGRVTSVIAHELVHIAKRHGQGLPLSDFNDREIELSNLLNTEKKFLRTVNEGLKLFLSEVGESVPLINKLQKVDFFSSWRFPKIDHETLSKMSSLTEAEKMSLGTQVSEMNWEKYDLLSVTYNKLRDTIYSIEKELEKSYDERNGEYRYIAFEEIEADEIGFVLYSKTGLPQDEFFALSPVQGLWQKFNFSRQCKDYNHGMNLKDVSMAEDFSHPTNCFRKQNIQRLISF